MATGYNLPSNRISLLLPNRAKVAILPLDKIFTDDVAVGDINGRMTALHDGLMARQTNLNQLLDSLTLCSQNLHLITIKWDKSQHLIKSLAGIQWRDVIYHEELGLTVVCTLLDILNDVIAIAPNTLQFILSGIVIKMWLGDQKSLDDEKILSSEGLVFNKIHFFLRDMVDTYPQASRLITTAIKSTFPHHQTATGHSLISYLYNTLVSLEYIIDIHPTLSLIVDKLTWLELSSQSHSIHNQIETNELELTKFFNLFDQAFDMFLDTIYDFLHPDGRIITSGELNRSDNFLNAFEAIFLKQIAPIDALVNLSFCLFYAASLSENLCARIIDRIWSDIVKNNSEFASRNAFLLASMLVELNSISSDNLMGFIETAIFWAIDYSQAHSNTMIDESYNPNIHSKFYAITQSILYIICCKINCFSETQLKALRLSKLQRLLQSPLNPLMFSLPTIVNEFAEISRHHQIALCSLILERNKRISLDFSSFFNRNLCFYFPFHAHNFIKAGKKFESLFNSMSE